MHLGTFIQKEDKLMNKYIKINIYLYELSKKKIAYGIFHIQGCNTLVFKSMVIWL